ncbi:MAG: hypothetical protein DCC68_17715 [Planctomycetota bacterium]|nr:MAG: hypothetical protein DCC68_17715 [Planctomycetota bacterium]
MIAFAHAQQPSVIDRRRRDADRVREVRGRMSAAYCAIFGRFMRQVVDGHEVQFIVHTTERGRDVWHRWTMVPCRQDEDAVYVAVTLEESFSVLKPGDAQMASLSTD